MWPMDEEQPPRLPVRSDAVASSWLTGERRPGAGSDRGDDSGVEGTSPRSTAGMLKRVGSLPYLECLAAPAMQFGGDAEELQGGSPMQISSTVAPSVDCSSEYSSHKCNGAHVAQSSAAAPDLLKDRQPRNGVHASSLIQTAVRSAAQADSQQHHGTLDRPTDVSGSDQPASAGQQPVPAATAYREKPASHAVDLSADCSCDGSGYPAQQGAAPAERQPNGHAEGVDSTVAARVPSDLDTPEQPPSTGTSPQHDRKRSRLRMDAACRARRGSAAAVRATAATGSTAAACATAAPNGASEAALRPVERSFELRLVPATPDVRPYRTVLFLDESAAVSAGYLLCAGTRGTLKVRNPLNQSVSGHR